MYNRVSRLAAAAAAALLLSAGVSPGVLARQDLAGVRNLTRVDAVVACAGATPVEAVAGIRQAGFAAIVNLRRADEPGADVEASRAAAEAVGLKYIHLPFDSGAPSPEVVTGFLAAVSDRTNQPVFVHCASANRVGALWLIKRVARDGWTIEQATAEARAIGLRSDRLEAFALRYLADTDRERR